MDLVHHVPRRFQRTRHPGIHVANMLTREQNPPLSLIQGLVGLRGVGSEPPIYVRTAVEGHVLPGQSDGGADLRRSLRVNSLDLGERGCSS